MRLSVCCSSYLCIALDIWRKKHRVLMAVVWYFVLSTVFQFLFMFFIMGVGNLPFDSVWMALANFFRGIGPTATIHIGMITLCVATAVPGAAFFSLAVRHILKEPAQSE